MNNKIVPPKADIVEIKRALSILFTPGDVIELRALDINGKTQAGYFSDFDQLAIEATRLSGLAAGIYVVLNQIDRTLLARSQNRIALFPKNLTQDKDITGRRWLPIDIDPNRPSGISSTDQEHAAALTVAIMVKTYLIKLGFPADSILTGDSGNGAHVLVRIVMQNDDEGETIIKACLSALAVKFDDSQITIDRSVFNAARIWKLAGTLARKGDNTADRPHRIARLLDVPATKITAQDASVMALAATAPKPKAPNATRGPEPFDVEKWLTENGIEVQSAGPYEGGTRYILKACPFNPAHTGTSVAAFKSAEGAPGFKCQHFECTDKKWADLRELKEPGYRNPKQPADWPLTDTGNAEYLTSLFGHEIRFDHRRQRWLLWKEHRWDPDRDGHISRLAIDSARQRYQDSLLISDLKARQAAAKWAISSENRSKIDACIVIARSIKPVADNGENWDSDIWLLGVNNGVVNLKTGDLRPGRLGDRITMTTGVDFDPLAKCPRWEQFLTEVFGETDLIDWLWRALGYTITGDTTEQCVFFGYGMGANGKGVFNGALQAALKDYAYSSPFSTFELYQRASIPNDLAALEFRRFVSSSETNDNTRLNEARIKAISGCDLVTARYLHEEFFTFRPHLKLWLFVNHKPKVIDDSFGFWRRVRLIPFTRQFSGKTDDRKLKGKLEAEAPGILAWLVRGCLEWQQRGLEPLPECIQVATRQYREESDIPTRFVADKCVEDPKIAIKANDLYSAYKVWAEAEGMSDREVLTATKFGLRMTERYKKEKRKDARYYVGIALNSGGLFPVDAENHNPSTEPDINHHNPTQKVAGLVVGYEASNIGTYVQPDSYTATRNNQRNPPQPTTETNNPPTKLNVGNNPSREDNGLKAVLGMSEEKAIALWRSAGAPVIHLGPGENCEDLGELLSRPQVPPEHLGAVKTWLQEHTK